MGDKVSEVTGNERNRSLLSWYDERGRELPWRRTRDRWAILVSEVMLQQTQVSRVVPAFNRFLASYPTPDAFAAASPEEVIAAWGGLGYLRRARSLHAAARHLRDSGWPQDLTDLPGVGPYTAAAVAAFADGHRVAAVDVNLRRVLSRWVGQSLSAARGQIVGREQVDAARPAHWNQAMMDLGASLCRPQPRCDECPVSEWCEDPEIDIASRPQSPYEGSVRQARAAVMKDLVGGPATRTRLGPGLDPATVDQALRALLAEGAVVGDGDRLRLG